MGRIRSIKPSFWTDGTNLELSDSCALFFIGLWNFCDDEGKHPLDLKQVVAELGGRWHVGKVKLYMSCLIKSGQLRLNSDSTWVQVTGWLHQKIDKPKQPDVKASDIQWLSIEDSTTALESSRPFGARIGEDRRDRIGGDSSTQKSKVAKAPRPTALAAVPLGQNLVAAYCDAYKSRYGSSVRVRPQDAKALKNFGESFGERLAKEIIQGYFAMNTSWFVTKSHDITTMLQNLNPIQNFLSTGQIVTTADARSAEASDTLANQIARVTK